MGWEAVAWLRDLLHPMGQERSPSDRRMPPPKSRYGHPSPRRARQWTWKRFPTRRPGGVPRRLTLPWARKEGSRLGVRPAAAAAGGRSTWAGTRLMGPGEGSRLRSHIPRPAHGLCVYTRAVSVLLQPPIRGAQDGVPWRRPVAGGDLMEGGTRTDPSREEPWTWRLHRPARRGHHGPQQCPSLPAVGGSVPLTRTAVLSKSTVM